MIILALDTCFNRCAACIYDSAQDLVLAQAQQEMERGQAEALAPMVLRLLSTVAGGIESLTRVAVTTGPGTFTGLRIGLSFARALGLARNIPVIGLDSLHAVALAASKSDGPALIAHKAGQSGFYYVLRGVTATTLETLSFEDLQLVLKSWNGFVLGTAAAELASLGQNNKMLQYDAARDLPDLKRLAVFASVAEAPSSMPEPVYLRGAGASPQGMPQAFVRKALSEDIPILVTLHQQAFAQGWSAADLSVMLRVAGTQILVIENNGGILGFILLRSILGEAEILTIAIARESRKKGVGKKLLQAALAACYNSGSQRMLLEVNADNTAALALYTSCGFTETGRRRAYYATARGKADAILMARICADQLT